MRPRIADTVEFGPETEPITGTVVAILEEEGPKFSYRVAYWVQAERVLEWLEPHEVRVNEV